MFGPESVRDIKGGKTVVVGNSRFDIVTEAALKAEFGDAAPDAEGRKAYMAGLTFRTVSLAKVAHALQEGKIDFVQSPGRLVVAARQAVNAVLEFVE
jgi:quinolinate synthase